LMIGTSSGCSCAIIGADGKLSGFDVDYMTKLATDLGLTPEITVVDFPGLLPGVVAGKFDLAGSGIVRSETRLKSTDFIMTGNYAVDGLGLLKRKGDTSITSWESVCGKKVGLNRGAAENGLAASLLPAGCLDNKTEYPNTTENVIDLKNKRTDAVINSFLTLGYMAAQDPAVELIPEPKSAYPFGLVVSKSNPELAAKVDELTKKYTADGTLDAIMKKYGVTIDWATIQN
ncbi:amino acid ABC transporter substrate-binding protein, partial [Mesorhizobium sp. M7D.F.Ca.US.004.03.1.1]|uniref:substrate-binding periplasmic protein n=1 Tax=Mesorhizobium sp. M7D.F.Ca.US.004.03.1.1 TaxID=2496702 RepID=UPI000FD58AA5